MLLYIDTYIEVLSIMIKNYKNNKNRNIFLTVEYLYNKQNIIIILYL